jgi:glycosyltransferase involved in cell wall biosynthesis
MGKYIKDSKVLNESFDCRYINLSMSGAINEIGKNPIGKAFRYLSLLCQLARQLIIFRPDLCYLTPYTIGKGFYKDAFIILILKLSRRKIIFHLHNKGIPDRQGKTFDGLLYSFIFRNIQVILLSEYLYNDVSKYVSPGRVHYCANGIPDTGVSEKLDFSNPEVLFLSNLIRSKGVECLIEACSILQKRNLKFHCTISGSDGDLRAVDLYEKIMLKGLENYISLLPPAYDIDKQQLLSSAGIFVHPSFNDCMPLALIEAMQYSLPVISTFEGAIPDLVDDSKTGFLVNQKDTVALADAMEKLICDPCLRKELGRNGYNKYMEQFTIGKFEKRLTEILLFIGEN